MAIDTPIPLCTPADLQEGALADLVRSFSAAALLSTCQEASRGVETLANRRFMRFTVTESHRADGVDPDDVLAGGVGLMDLQTAQGVSYANALGGAAGQVRKVWVDECAPHYPDMWSYSNVSVTVMPSVGGTQVVTPRSGPVPDTGLLVFDLGTYCPPGSLVQVTYTGEYVTVPAGLRRAAKWLAAAICCGELDPDAVAGHDASSLERRAEKALRPYMRS